MKVWLDDLRQVPHNYDVHVKDAGNCIIILSTGKVTHIAFDHDLADKDTGEFSEQTGYTVAKYIETEAYYGRLPRLTWSVHTDNPDGRKNIVAAMENADRYWSKMEQDFNG